MRPSKIVLHGVKHARTRQIKLLSKGQSRLLYVDTSLKIMLRQENALVYSCASKTWTTLARREDPVPGWWKNSESLTIKYHLKNKEKK